MGYRPRAHVALPEEEQRVKNAYVLERKFFLARTRGLEQLSDRVPLSSSWDGGTDSRGIKHTCIWRGIINKATARRLDPVTVIKAAFLVKGTTGHPPNPNELCTEEVMEAAQCLHQQSHEELTLTMQAHQREAETMVALMQLSRDDEVEPSKYWREVIVSPTFTAGPLFRYALACSLAQADLARRIRHSAALEYIRAPDIYDEIMGKFLPRDFREGSRQLLEKFLSDSV